MGLARRRGYDAATVRSATIMSSVSGVSVLVRRAVGQEVQEIGCPRWPRGLAGRRWVPRWTGTGIGGEGKIQVFKRRLRRQGEDARRGAIPAPAKTCSNVACSLSTEAITDEAARRPVLSVVRTISGQRKRSLPRRQRPRHTGYDRGLPRQQRGARSRGRRCCRCCAPSPT